MDGQHGAFDFGDIGVESWQFSVKQQIVMSCEGKSPTVAANQTTPAPAYFPSVHMASYPSCLELPHQVRLCSWAQVQRARRRLERWRPSSLYWWRAAWGAPFPGLACGISAGVGAAPRNRRTSPDCSD